MLAHGVGQTGDHLDELLVGKDIVAKIHADHAGCLDKAEHQKPVTLHQPSVLSCICTDQPSSHRTSPLQARDKQLARLQREEKLGALQVELGNKKTLRLTQLRTFARVVGIHKFACIALRIVSQLHLYERMQDC